MTLIPFTGLRLLANNCQAWQAKRDLIASARLSLDLVYFIVEDDATSCRLLLDLVAAAERGVQVRLLVDHFMTWRQAPVLRALIGVDKLQIRRFRPPEQQWLDTLKGLGIDPGRFVQALTTSDAKLLVEVLRDKNVTNQEIPVPAVPQLAPQADENRLAYAFRVLATWRAGPVQSAHIQGLLDQLTGGLDRYLHRTHHKLLLADQRCFIMGGRNLGDAYHCHALPKGHAFRDIELQCCADPGPANAQVAAFHMLWDRGLMQAIEPVDPLDSRPALLRTDLQTRADTLPLTAPAGLRMPSHLPNLHGQLVNNLPGENGDAAITQAYIARIRAQAALGSGVIDIVNAYVCLGGDGSDSVALGELYRCLLAAAAAGVTVNLRTNSISTTDLKPVNQAAYRRLAALIKGGVRVFELADGQGSLHAKAAAIGTSWLMVGSYNLDPRSELYDTNNLVVLKDSHGLACQALRGAMVKGLSWRRLTLQRARQLARVHQQAPMNWPRLRRLL